MDNGLDGGQSPRAPKTSVFGGHKLGCFGAETVALTSNKFQGFLADTVPANSRYGLSSIQMLPERSSMVSANLSSVTES
jgi:hypothetical protein